MCQRLNDSAAEDGEADDTTHASLPGEGLVAVCPSSSKSSKQHAETLSAKGEASGSLLENSDLGAKQKSRRGGLALAVRAAAVRASENRSSQRSGAKR